MLRSAQILELVAEHAADRYVWRAPFTIELRSCGSSNADWNVATHKLTMCYEMAEEYIQLYRDYTDGFKVAAAPSSPDGLPINPQRTGRLALGR